MVPSSQPDPSSHGDGPDGWTVDLDADLPDGPQTSGTVRTARSGQAEHAAQARAAATAGSLTSSLRRWTALALVVVLGSLTAAWWSIGDDAPPPATAAVLGRHLAAPVALRLPPGAVATADGSYVGVQFANGGVVLVTVPTQVVDPSGERVPMPDDPAAWLAGHPSIFISRMRDVRIGGAPATQLDYRRSRMDAPTSRFARLPLFCGWRTEVGPVAACTQITADARVRATFVRIRGRTVLVEAVWRSDGTGPGRMPRDLQRAYASLLAGLTPTSPGA